ncbi:MAG: prolyl oligopeptidase family serine peptidase [Bdellovibrionales bacterium]
MKILYAVILSLLVFGCVSPNLNESDENVWLEEISSKEALSWVEQESSITKKNLSKEAGFEERRKRILKVLGSKDKTLYVGKRGKYVYNLWKDVKNPRGLWRRVPYTYYVRGWKLNWETVLDIDKLSKDEGVKWVFKGVLGTPEDNDTVILKLSDGGKDAHHLREFSLKNKKFNEDGFVLGEARYNTAMVNTGQLLIATNTDPKRLTRSGYPRDLKILNKGESIEDAKIISSIPKNHTGYWVYQVERADKKKFIFIEDSIDFFSSNKYLYMDAGLVEIPVPQKSSVEGVFHNKIIFSLKEKAVIAEESFSEGELVYLEVKEDGTFSKVKSFLKLSASEALKRNSIAATKNYLFVVLQENVSRKGYRVSFDKEGEIVKEKISLDGEISIIDSDLDSDRVILQSYDFLTPQTVYVYDLKSGSAKIVQHGKSYFSKRDYTYKQDWAVSEDGTKIPFYIVHQKGMKNTGANPTIMYGYGGFEISVAPFYLKTRVNEWVSKGGVFVIANIRGGGEFGPSWHKAAQKFNKRKSYEDFAAVAKKLHITKVTSPRHLGIVGGSNGGLLVGASSVLYPNLYGAVFCAVPLLDMLRYDQLLVGSSWIPEYGDPKIKKERDYIKTYSPYQNVQETVSYPKMFFYTSTYDDRVHPGHARKMYKKMKDQGHKVYYYENSEGGHAGSSDLKQRALSDAMKFTFFWKVLK